MKYIKYFVQFLFAISCFLIFKILGPRLSSNLGGKIFEIIGPFFRSEKIINSNIKKAIPDIDLKIFRTPNPCHLILYHLDKIYSF